MSALRLLCLTLGPVAIVGALYALTAPAALQGSLGKADMLPTRLPAATAPPADAGESLLEELCRERGVETASQLDAGCRILVRPPFVLGGDLSDVELERCYRNVVVPLQQALSTSFFDAEPDAPVVILMFSNREAYEEHALRLDGRRPTQYSGYYRREQRRILLNLGTGTGTLAHELTHALAHFDFPAMPEWFDEGLAALCEESQFSADGLRIHGTGNWRLNHLLDGLRRGHLQPLESLIGSGGVRPQFQAVDYAQARYFCLYLQHRELLGPFYRKLRARAGSDSSGLATLCDLFHVATLESIERDFLQWVQSQAPVRAAPGEGRAELRSPVFFAAAPEWPG